MQDNSDLARFLARNKNLASFLASVACKIFTIFLQDMQENGHFAWTSCKISKKYRKVRPRLWDLACMILARIVDELARWFDLGMIIMMFGAIIVQLSIDVDGGTTDTLILILTISHPYLIIQQRYGLWR